MLRRPMPYIIAYAVIALITFGYAAATHKADPCGSWCFWSEDEQKAHSGLAAALAWPLYWSWTAFELTEQGH